MVHVPPGLQHVGLEVTGHSVENQKDGMPECLLVLSRE